jgi:hypothetical protein
VFTIKGSVFFFKSLNDENLICLLEKPVFLLKYLYYLAILVKLNLDWNF